MSRVGKKAIDIPDSINVKLEGNKITVENKNKKLEHIIPNKFKVDISKNTITVIRPSDSRINKALHGTTRSIIQNMIIGVKDGFEKKLLIKGVGYKAQKKGKTLVLDIGFSHSVNYSETEGIEIATPSPTEIIVKGIDKQKVGQVAANIRAFYPPEPYKGKGIRYENEIVRQKQGKSVS